MFGYRKAILVMAFQRFFALPDKGDKSNLYFWLKKALYQNIQAKKHFAQSKLDKVD